MPEPPQIKFQGALIWNLRKLFWVASRYVDWASSATTQILHFGLCFPCAATTLKRRAKILKNCKAWAFKNSNCSLDMSQNHNFLISAEAIPSVFETVLGMVNKDKKNKSGSILGETLKTRKKQNA